jgi:hypothetical protein
VLGYLKSISLAANAVATLTGSLLAERRFLLQFPISARNAGQPALSPALLNLLGAGRVDAATLAGYLPDWEKAFIEAAGSPDVDSRIAAPRLGYYKLAFESILASEAPQAILWPMLLTWTLSVSVLPSTWEVRWRSACVTLGLDKGSFGDRLAELDQFLNGIEAIQENLSARPGQ